MALTFVVLYGIHRLAGVLLVRWRKRFGFEELSDFASLPLLMLLAQVFMLVLMPIGLAYSRHIEHEADRFGLEITHYNHSAATGFTRLQEENLGVPRPGWFYTIFSWLASVHRRPDRFFQHLQAVGKRRADEI